MITIPKQSSVAMAFKEFNEAGRMRPSSYYDRIVDVMEDWSGSRSRPARTRTSSLTASPNESSAGEA